MSLKSKGDPLSRYFKDLNESDIDSDEHDDDNDNDDSVDSGTDNLKLESAETDQTSTRNDNISAFSVASEQENNSSANAKGPLIQKLPSARDCFDSKSNPAFLNLHRKKEIDWDHSSNLKLFDDNESNQVIDYKSNAVPPPTSYEPVTDSSIKVVDSEGRKRKSSTDELEEKRISSKTYRLGGETSQQTDTSGS